MRLPGRLAAAAEVLDEILTRHRPVQAALKEWARAHRFAGSGDRAAIGNIVYDALRQKASLSYAMQSESALDLALGVLRWQWGMSAEEIGQTADAEHGPGKLSPEQLEYLDVAELDHAPVWVRANVPKWLEGELIRTFGDDAVTEGKALAKRAPVDIRVNTLKADTAKVLSALAKYAPASGLHLDTSIRLPMPARDGRQPNVEADPAHARGWLEIQDQASQIAAQLCGARPGQQVLDLCAGAGGKTLALAAQMQNKGQLFAHDMDKHRLRPIFDRLKRAGVRNAQVIGADETARLDELLGRMDVTVIDAPCSGSGSWRRKPDAKWRLTQAALDRRVVDQAALLENASRFVKADGLLVYITCSMLACENADQVGNFLAQNRFFSAVAWQQVWSANMPGPSPENSIASEDFLQLTPARHDMDGFFIAVLKKVGQ